MVSDLIISDQLYNRQIRFIREEDTVTARPYWVGVEIKTEEGIAEQDDPFFIIYEKFDVEILPVCYFWKLNDNNLQVYRMWGYFSPSNTLDSLKSDGFIWQEANSKYLNFFPIKCPSIITIDQERNLQKLLVSAMSEKPVKEQMENQDRKPVSKEFFLAEWANKHPYVAPLELQDLEPVQKNILEALLNTALPAIEEELFDIWADLLRAVKKGAIDSVFIEESNLRQLELINDARVLRYYLFPANIDKLSFRGSIPTIGAVYSFLQWLLSREVAYYQQNLKLDLTIPLLSASYANTLVGRLATSAEKFTGLTLDQNVDLIILHEFYENHPIPIGKLKKILPLIDGFLNHNLSNSQRAVMDDLISIIITAEGSANSEQLGEQLEQILREKNKIISSRLDQLARIEKAITDNNQTELVDIINSRQALSEGFIDIHETLRQKFFILLGDKTKEIIINNAGLVEVLMQIQPVDRVVFCNFIDKEFLFQKSNETTSHSWGGGTSYLWSSANEMTQITFITNGDDLETVLAIILEEDRLIFCADTLGVDALREMIKSAFYLGKILSHIPESETKRFCIDIFGVEAIKSCIYNAHNDLSFIAEQINYPGGWVNFCTEVLGEDFMITLRNNEGVLSTLYKQCDDEKFVSGLFIKSITSTIQHWISLEKYNWSISSEKKVSLATKLLLEIEGIGENELTKKNIASLLNTKFASSDDSLKIEILNEINRLFFQFSEEKLDLQEIAESLSSEKVRKVNLTRS